MNIFVLSKEPQIAAQCQIDKHVVKMSLESAQLLCSPFRQGVAPYKRTHYNHPCAIWLRTSIENYKWLLDHAFALTDEYNFRYGKHHKSKEVIAWCADNYKKLDLPSKGLTPFALAMPDQYKVEDPILSYRNYYRGDKKEMATWKVRQPPDWWF